MGNDGDLGGLGWGSWGMGGIISELGSPRSSGLGGSVYSGFVSVWRKGDIGALEAGR